MGLTAPQHAHDRALREAKREAQRQWSERYYAAETAALHQHLAEVVERGLAASLEAGATSLMDLARAAVEALEADGVVFARMGAEEDQCPTT